MCVPHGIHPAGSISTTPSPTSLPCPMGSSLSSTAPSPIPAMLHSPVPLSDLRGPLALSLLAGEMREVSWEWWQATSAPLSSSSCHLRPAPGHASASQSQHRLPLLLLGENQLVTAHNCPWHNLTGVRALWAHMEEGGKHIAAETSLLGCLQPAHGPEPLGAVPPCPCFLHGGFSCPIPTRYVMPTAPGEYRALRWHLEGGRDGAYWCRQGCSENLSWVLPPVCVTSHCHDPGEVSRSWGTVLLATVLLVSEDIAPYSCPATAMSSQWLKGQTLLAQCPQPRRAGESQEVLSS